MVGAIVNWERYRTEKLINIIKIILNESSVRNIITKFEKINSMMDATPHIHQQSVRSDDNTEGQRRSSFLRDSFNRKVKTYV